MKLIFLCAPTSKLPNKYEVYASVATNSAWIDAHIQGGVVGGLADLPYILPDQDTPVENTFSNLGASPVMVNAVAFDEGGPFTSTIVEDQCSGQMVPAGGDCVVLASINAPEAVQGLALTHMSVQLADAALLTTKATIAADVLGRIANADAVLDIADLPWFTGGFVAWSTQVDATAEGGSSMQSGDIQAIGGDGATLLATKLQGPGTLTFNYKTNAMLDFGYLEIYVDGEFIKDYTGIVDWSTDTIALGAGTHEVLFVYAQYGFVEDPNFMNRVWLDKIVYNVSAPPAPVVVEEPPAAAPPVVITPTPSTPADDNIPANLSAGGSEDFSDAGGGSLSLVLIFLMGLLAMFRRMAQKNGSDNHYWIYQIWHREW
ncbi:MAG: hypothetical protein P8176_13045 [Gammaproteobacteria bacterium]